MQKRTRAIESEWSYSLVSWPPLPLSSTNNKTIAVHVINSSKLNVCVDWTIQKSTDWFVHISWTIADSNIVGSMSSCTRVHARGHHSSSHISCLCLFVSMRRQYHWCHISSIMFPFFHVSIYMMIAYCVRSMMKKNKNTTTYDNDNRLPQKFGKKLTYTNLFTIRFHSTYVRPSIYSLHGKTFTRG